MSQQTNGNTQLNEARNNVNNKIFRYGILGTCKGRVWRRKLRFRSI